MTDPEIFAEGPADARLTLILAHGAGQPMRSPFMNHIADGLAAGGLRVVRFEFPYMADMQATGRRRTPDREPVLLATWNRVIDTVLAKGLPRDRLLIGGKSMGGRMASLVADERGVAGLVCLGYPFHPPGRPGQLRVAHLQRLVTPTLICQGARDTFGNRTEVSTYSLSAAIRFAWIEEGEHSFKPRAKSARTWEENLDRAAVAVLKFTGGLGGGRDGLPCP